MLIPPALSHDFRGPDSVNFVNFMPANRRPAKIFAQGRS
jgi:hypothetical protein